MEQNVYVKKSTIPRAGMGIFANKNFKKDEFITGYGGTPLSSPSSLYILTDCHGISWDAEKEYDSDYELGRYANDADHNTPFTNNAYFDTCPFAGIPPVLRASRKIHKGEEIFCGYGPQYWKKIEERFPRK